MAHSNGRSFAQRINGAKPIIIPDSSDEDVPESMHKGQGMMDQSDVSSLRLSHSSESGTGDSFPLSHKSTEGSLGAKELASEYDPGNPYLESEAEPEQPATSHVGKETSEEGSYAKQCLAAAKEVFKSSRLEHEEVTKMIEQSRIKRRQLEQKMDDISGFMGAIEKYCL